MRLPYRRVALIAAILTGGMSFASASLVQDLPPGDGRDIVQSACTGCHGVDVIVSQRHTPDEWRDVVSQMVGNGASLTDDQYVTVVTYLGTAFGPAGAAPAPTAQATPAMPPATTVH
jgi:mono/diheme cytochrome c family protein